MALAYSHYSASNSQTKVPQADNTAREHKNQYLVIFSAYLVASGRADSVSNHFFIVGHTHNRVDQRFSVIGGALKKSPQLQTPQDFLDVIKNELKAGRNAKIHTEHIDAVHDWKAFFQPLGITISGIVSTATDPVVNHAWRLVRRGDLVDYSKAGQDGWAVEVPEDTSNETLLYWLCSMVHHI